MLGSNEYQDMVGVERAGALDTIDTRIKQAEEWLFYYESERSSANRHLGMFRSRRLLSEISALDDEELEGRV